MYVKRQLWAYDSGSWITVLGLWERGGVRCKVVVGGSNHCRVAKFRGLIIRGKHGAVIGRKTRPV